jgi:hypothetical protein
MKAKKRFKTGLPAANLIDDEDFSVPVAAVDN